MVEARNVPIYEIAVKDATAQDLYFVEREIEEASVKEVPTKTGTNSFGLPGFFEALIIASSTAALIAAVSWVVKNRKRGALRIRRKSTPDGTFYESIDAEWTEESSDAEVLDKVTKWAR